MVESGMSLCDLVRAIPEETNCNMMFDTFDKYEHFIVAMSNQYDRRHAWTQSHTSKLTVNPDTGEVCDK